MSIEISPELRHFMMDERRVAKLASNRKSGGPWVQPIWFMLDGNDPMLIIAKDSVTGRILRRDPRVALCVDDVEVPYGFAILEGEVELSDDQDLCATWMRQMIVRYRPEIADVDGHLKNLLSDFASMAGRVKLERAYFEPVVSPPPPEA
jgi:PPOX class probable F420-dependent enzyme